MGGLLDKPKPVTIAPPKPAPPVPTVDEDVVGTEAKKKRPRGFKQNIITGDLVPEPTKKTLLG
jgi:hypothetical protein